MGCGKSGDVEGVGVRAEIQNPKLKIQRKSENVKSEIALFLRLVDALAHAEDRIDGVSAAFIEGDDVGVRFADL